MSVATEDLFSSFLSSSAPLSDLVSTKKSTKAPPKAAPKNKRKASRKPQTSEEERLLKLVQKEDLSYEEEKELKKLKRRKQNRDAAQRSRAKKRLLVSDLEARLKEISEDNKRLLLKLEALEAENMRLRGAERGRVDEPVYHAPSSNSPTHPDSAPNTPPSLSPESCVPAASPIHSHKSSDVVDAVIPDAFASNPIEPIYDNFSLPTPSELAPMASSDLPPSLSSIPDSPLPPLPTASGDAVSPFTFLPSAFDQQACAPSFESAELAPPQSEKVCTSTGRFQQQAQTGLLLILTLLAISSPPSTSHPPSSISSSPSSSHLPIKTNNLTPIQLPHCAYRWRRRRRSTFSCEPRRVYDDPRVC